MKVLLAAVCVVFTLCFFIESGLAIKCYECNSFFQQDCVDWFDNKTHNLVDCAADNTMCRKIVQEVYMEDKWDVRYIRQCAKTGEVGDDEGRVCKDRAGTYKVKVKYCHCNNQEGCNGATSTQMSFLLTLIPVVAMVFIGARKFL